MPLGMLDLSIVTDRLIKLLQDCIAASLLWQEEATITPEGTPPGISPGIPPAPGTQFQIQVTGAPPDTIRTGSGCQLSLYLFHVTQDKYQRNSPVIAPLPAPPGRPAHARAQLSPQQPLSLNLYYLLTAYAGDQLQSAAYIEEQQAMSVALKCFHDHPIVTANVPFGNTTAPEEFTLTMEIETADDLGRLWLSITTSLRLAAVYKVSVIFLLPEPPPTPAVVVSTYNLSVNPAMLPFATQGQVIATFQNVSYVGPGNVTKQYDQFPATVAAGQTFLLYGAGLKPPPAQPPSAPIKVYLLDSSGAEQDVTATWLFDPTLATHHADSQVTLKVPSVATPPAGVYQLRIGFGTYRSNATPFSISALVNPTDGPILLPGIGGIYTISGAGFIPNQTEVLLETVPLGETGANPAAGQFSVAPGGTSITFRPPISLPTGRYAVRTRVNHVESAPAKWIDQP